MSKSIILDNITDMLRDDNGVLWAASDAGVSVFLGDEVEKFRSVDYWQR